MSSISLQRSCFSNRATQRCFFRQSRFQYKEVGQYNLNELVKGSPKRLCNGLNRFLDGVLRTHPSGVAVGPDKINGLNAIIETIKPVYNELPRPHQTLLNRIEEKMNSKLFDVSAYMSPYELLPGPIMLFQMTTPGLKVIESPGKTLFDFSGCNKEDEDRVMSQIQSFRAQLGLI